MDVSGADPKILLSFHFHRTEAAPIDMILAFLDRPRAIVPRAQLGGWGVVKETWGHLRVFCFQGPKKMGEEKYYPRFQPSDDA